MDPGSVIILEHTEATKNDSPVNNFNDTCKEKCEEILFDCLSNCSSEDQMCISDCLRNDADCNYGKISSNFFATSHIITILLETFNISVYNNFLSLFEQKCCFST